jgi:prepilin-type N-terminal cleavage/methylation domain-containing protein
MKKRRGGFSLLETLLVISLMSILAAVGVVNTRIGASRGQTSGLAEIVAEELRGARFRAMSQNTPVAVVFPSGGGTAGHCQSLYVLEGQEKPKVTRSSDFSKEYPDSQIFVGTWASSPAVSTDDIQAGSQAQQINVAQWGLPIPSDYAIMFTPAGTVKTNGLPSFKGQYHIVVSAGLKSSPASQPSLPLKYFKLESVGPASTISLGPSGGVTLESGVVEGSSVTRENQPVATVAGAPLQLPAPPPANQDPVVKAAHVEPDSETEFEIQPGCQAALTVEATDPDGDPLYLSCTTNPPGLGKFSASSPTRMDWVPATATEPGFYRGNWVWNPPKLTAGDQVELNYKITDGRGATVSNLIATGTASDKQTVISYSNQSRHNLNSEICVIQPGVSPRRWVTPFGDNLVCMDASFSPDNKRLAFRGWPRLGDGPTQLYVCNTDRTGLAAVSSHCDDIGPGHPPAWSSSGTKIVVSNFGVGGGLMWLNPFGSSTQQLTNHPEDHSVECSPVTIDGKDRVLFIRDKSVCSVSLEASPSELVHATWSGAGNVAEPHWSPDGTKLAYVAGDASVGQAQIKVLELSTNTETVVASGYNNISSLRFSPDGKYLAFIRGDEQELLAVGVDGKNPGHPAVTGPRSLASNRIGPCNWSPDSTQLVFGKTQPDSRSFLGRVNVLTASTNNTFIRPFNQNYRAFLSPTWGVKE